MKPNPTRAPRCAPALLRLMYASSALALALACTGAHAGKCVRGDSWRGPDKVAHANVGAAIGSIVTLHTGNAWQGFAWGAAAGVGKEAADSAGLGTCSARDALATIAGAAIGAVVARQFVVEYRPERRALAVTYVRQW